MMLIPSIQKLSMTLTPNNHVSIKGPINTQMSSTFISNLNKINSTNIYIYIDSHGGSVDAGHKMIQYINFKKDNNHTILCIAQQADSMAFHIFQHCTHRYILPDSKMMQHQMSIHNLSGNIENLYKYIKVSYQLYENLIYQGSKRIGITSKNYKEKINNDWYLYGEDIVKNRVADAMISSIGCSEELTRNDNIVVVDGNIVQLSLCPLI